jgi:5-methyltetrahydrofolate--homocysteine methyltransferase
VLEGDAPGCKAGGNAALAEGIPAETILKAGLTNAMDEMGRQCEANEYFVSEMLVAARAMQQRPGILKLQLAEGGSTPMGKVIIGTVRGDLYDIGKNLVAMMLEGSGFEVNDLGTDVSPDKFVTGVIEHKLNVAGMRDLAPFEDVEHLALWSGMCSGNDESAGKRHGGKSRKGGPRAPVK